jgi:hypothetical protein
MNIDYDELFALRMHYQDIYEDEYRIIQLIKNNLLNKNYNINTINNSLINFYNSIDINFSREEIENIHPYVSIFNQLFNNIDDDVLNNFISQLHQTLHSNNEDVICTLDNNDKEQLTKTILNENLVNNCSICIDCLKKNEEIIELPCNHIFHSACILEWLEKYNYHCPICRKEVGTPKYNI